MNTLLLGSTSQSRQMLLREAQISFQVIGHSANEEMISRALPFKDLLQDIARYKMEHVNMPAGKEGDVVFVLTADSMGHDKNGVVHGKPKDREDALRMIHALSENSITATAFCLDRKRYHNGVWNTEMRIERYVQSTYRFNIPQQWIDRYLEHSWALIASGAIAVELYGAQFMESVNGSYTAIVGLPMFELRESLEKIGFF